MDISDVPNALLETLALMSRLEKHSDPEVVKIANQAKGQLRPALQAMAQAVEQLAALPL